MKSSYEILNVSADASDDEIKLAYLQQVKIYPPDHHQQQFQLIHQAYESIKDHTQRIKYALFSLIEANFDEVIDQSLSASQTIQINSQQFKQLLCASIEDDFIMNAFLQNHEK